MATVDVTFPSLDVSVTNDMETKRVVVRQEAHIINQSSIPYLDVAAHALTATSASYAQTVGVSVSIPPGTVSSSAQAVDWTVATSSVATSASHALYADNADLLDGVQASTLATTGSNTFVGDQTTIGDYRITGSAYVSGAVSANYIDFSDGVPAWNPGRLAYDPSEGSLIFYNDEADITLQIGQESWTRVINKSGQILADGTPVMVSGSQGDVPAVYLAKANAANDDMNVYHTNHIFGLATHTIGINAIGYVTTNGIVRGIDTTNFMEGASLFVSSSAGKLTQTAPPKPYESIHVGYVVRSQIDGQIYVDPHDSIHLEHITGISGSIYGLDNALLMYNSASRQWYPTTTVSASFSGSFIGTVRIPTSSGAPVFTPGTTPGFVPMYYDQINNFMYVYSNNTWKSSSFV